ncbi:ORF6C domain-containing protein [Solibacillus sp. FSL R7-0668]|uniref:ORF6C domain-containing protein n=1 Tax=Solibacillus sp. FSL R7-0668 TaxID=2921688 RepID=UPI0030FC6D62
MNQLQVIVYRQARVLTTGQLSECYGTDEKRISENFSRNKTRYTEGKHFILLQGEELKAFKKTYPQIAEQSKRAPMLYLWTEKGAWLHAKSLNTDAAWDAYEMLVDEYYKIIEQQTQDPVELALQTSLKNYQEIKGIKEDVTLLKDGMRIDGRQEYALKEQGKAKVLQELGGYGSLAYEKLSRKVFAQLWRDFKKHFVLPRSMELPRSKFDEGVKFIAMWRPDTSLAIDIEAANKQAQFKLVE